MRISDWSSDVCSSDLDEVVDLSGDRAADRTDLRGRHARVDAELGQRRIADGIGIGAWVEGRIAGRRRLGLTDFVDVGRADGPLIHHPDPKIVDRLPVAAKLPAPVGRSEEHTSELQSLMPISYTVFFLTKKHNEHFIITITQLTTQV